MYIKYSMKKKGKKLFKQRERPWITILITQKKKGSYQQYTKTTRDPNDIAGPFRIQNICQTSTIREKKKKTTNYCRVLAG